MKNIIDRIKTLICHTDFYEHQKIIVLLNMLKNKIDEIYKDIEKRLHDFLAIIFTKNEDEINNEDEFNKIDKEQETLNEHLSEFSEIKNLIDNNIENIFTKLIEKKNNAFNDTDYLNQHDTVIRDYSLILSYFKNVNNKIKMKILKYSDTVNTKLQSKLKEYEDNDNKNKLEKLKILYFTLYEVNQNNIKIIS